METCTKRCKIKDWLGEESWICGKPAVRTVGPDQHLCSKHNKAHVQKMTKWIDRKGYVECTEEWLLKGNSVKLADTTAHRLYRRKADGKIWQWNITSDKYDIATDIPADYKLFAYKIT